MKKAYFLVFGLLLTGLLLTACGELPDDPREIQPYCEELYQTLLADYPDFPHAFIGHCVATLQTGEPRGYHSLCKSASVREAIGVSTQQECLDYFENPE